MKGVLAAVLSVERTPTTATESFLAWCNDRFQSTSSTFVVIGTPVDNNIIERINFSTWSF